MYLEVLCGLGSIGFLAFVALFVVSFLSVIRARKTFMASGFRAAERLSAGIQVSMVVFMANAFFLSADEMLTPWMMIGVCGALSVIATRLEAGQPNDTANGMGTSGD
jgi:hypothetical protein